MDLRHRPTDEVHQAGHAKVTYGLCCICRNYLSQKPTEGVESSRGQSVMRQSVVLQSVNVTPITSYVSISNHNLERSLYYG